MKKEKTLIIIKPDRVKKKLIGERTCIRVGWVMG
jgi:nucleoside diphosphate kinase